MYTLYDNYLDTAKEYKSLHRLAMALRNSKKVNMVLANYGMQKMHTIVMTTPKTTSSGAMAMYAQPVDGPARFLVTGPDGNKPVPYEELAYALLKVGCKPRISDTDAIIEVKELAPTSLRAARAAVDTETKAEVLHYAGPAMAAKLFRSTTSRPKKRKVRQRNDWKSKKRVRQWSQNAVRVVSRYDLRVAAADDETRWAITADLLQAGGVW